jgi:hypothetical protein
MQALPGQYAGQGQGKQSGQEGEHSQDMRPPTRAPWHPGREEQVTVRCKLRTLCCSFGVARMLQRQTGMSRQIAVAA